MSSKADAEDLRGGQDNLDVANPAHERNGLESNRKHFAAGFIDGAETESVSAQTSSSDSEQRKNDGIEAGQLEEETTLPPILVSRSAAERERSSTSTPDNAEPSNSSPGNSAHGSRAASRIVNRHAAGSFDRRFQTRVASTSSTIWSTPPAFLTPQSRQSSITSRVSLDENSELGNSRPWDVVRWSKLKKMSTQAFSEAAKRTFGSPTFLTVSSLIAVGTCKGIILLFDYHQSLTSIIGQGTPATECGAIASLAISADHSTIAAGHVNGSIFTWDLSRLTKPFLHIPPIARSKLSNRKSDGHVIGCAVLHIGFLGQRHTALVSADDSGMAFSHLASRGLGSVGRNVRTTRILGRYPDLPKPQRPSSVLASAPLPLGNVTQATDDFGLVALLTPYLLVIVSTTPVAQTHFKISKIKDIASHSALTGCLAWFPAVRVKDSSIKEAQATSRTKLVYCWSNVLSLLEVEASQSVDDTEPVKIPELTFKQQGSWKSDEAILAVQWMNRSIIAVLTITQRLIILNGDSLSVADSSDLNSKHIYHHDVFSQLLLPALDKVEQEHTSMPGVVADAYYMSFKAYKGRLFLLGANEISLGTLSNWADRLMALMEAGNPISAIELATSYYNDDTYKVTLGLPHDNKERQALVKTKILELLSGSLQYLFNDEEHRRIEEDMRSVLHDFARVAFAACISIEEVSFLFDMMYDWFADSSVQDVFLFELEHYIIQHKIDRIPITIFKDLLAWYASHDLGIRLEKILCALQTDTMDIDQVSAVCMQLQLYDALISVWNRALNDYVTPLIQIMSIARTLRDNNELDRLELEQRMDSAMKMFPYMACTLTGRRYPDGSDMPLQESLKAKASMYDFIFADRTVEVGYGLSELLRPQAFGTSEPNYPYLRFFLHFDSFSFMSMLNEAYEDSFLNGNAYQSGGHATTEELLRQTFATSINRQRIVNILVEVISPPDFGFEDTIYLDIFLARNLAKYAQFILLSGSSVRQILVELCRNRKEGLGEECQLSVEYLLSTYHPSDLLDLVPLFAEAGFFRVLKSTYRGSKQFAKWLEAHFEDPDNKQAIFTSIGDCMRPNSGLSKRQIRDVKSVIADHVNDLAEIDAASTAECLAAYASDMLDQALGSLEWGSRTQFTFLERILESQPQGQDAAQPAIKSFCEAHRDFYVNLMCKYDAQHVANYVSLLSSGDLHLDDVLPAMEASGAVDAAVIILTNNGLTHEAMRRLIRYLNTLQTALVGLLDFRSEPSEISANENAVADVLETIQKYVKVGIWLCQQGSSPEHQRRSPQGQQFLPTPDAASENNLSAAESLWLELIDSVVKISQTTAVAAAGRLTDKSKAERDTELSAKTTEALRQVVQHAFTGLLAVTSHSAGASNLPPLFSLAKGSASQVSTSSNPVQQVRFLHVLTSFMLRLASRSSSISSVRSVLNTIFSTYLFESSMLTLANALLDKDVFLQVAEAEKRRRLGWRPKGQLCEGCKRRAWGPSAGGGAWEAWRLRRSTDEATRRHGHAVLTHVPSHALGDASSHKGKGREASSKADQPVDNKDENGEADTTSTGQDALIVFSCMHVFHRRCMDAAANHPTETTFAPGSNVSCPLCST